MFGHQDDKKDDEQSSEHENVITPDQPAEAATDTAVADQAAPVDDTPAPMGAADSDTTTDTPGTAPTTDDQPAADAPDDDNAWGHPGTPLPDTTEDKADEEEDEKEETKGPEPIKDIVGSSAGPDFKPFPQIGNDSGQADTENTPHELIDIKAKALTDLTPLVDKLEQSPEDKFRTVMMMIQASDDQSLVETAYKAAHEIKDEKARAQALLDVVNEINYFTQHPEN